MSKSKKIKAAVSKDDVETRQVTKEIEVKLTPIEMAEMLRRAGELQIDVAEKKKAFAQVKADHNQGVKNATDELEKLLAAGHEGRLLKLIECEMIKDFNAKSVSFKYNGDIVEERPMTEEELQPDFLESAAHSENDSDEDELPLDEQIKGDIAQSINRRTASSAVN